MTSPDEAMGQERLMGISKPAGNPAVANYGTKEVRSRLDYAGCVDAVRDAMMDFSAEDKPTPLREILTIEPGKLFVVMKGWLAPPKGFGAKIISVFNDPDTPGRSRHDGLVFLFDQDNGKPIANADAGEITGIRTGAASAVATEALARPDARRLAIFGCGHEARTHIFAISSVRQLDVVLVWGRSFDRASAFAASMAKATDLSIRAVQDPREAAMQADIICTVTGAQQPILLRDWVRPGTHINAVGSSQLGPIEIDPQLVAASRYIADSRRSALAAAAELAAAREAGLVDNDHVAGEIGEVLLGRLPGRTSATDITMYKSLGHIVQDLAAVRYLHDKVVAGRV